MADGIYRLPKGGPTSPDNRRIFEEISNLFAIYFKKISNFFEELISVGFKKSNCLRNNRCLKFPNDFTLIIVLWSVAF